MTSLLTDTAPPADQSRELGTSSAFLFSYIMEQIILIWVKEREEKDSGHMSLKVSNKSEITSV